MALMVAVIGVACAGLLSRYLTLSQFDVYVATNEKTDFDRLRLNLQQHYQERGNWEGVQDELDSMGKVSNKQFILVDAERKLLAAFPADLLRANIQVSPAHDLTWQQQETRGRELLMHQMMFRNVPHQVIDDSKGTAVGTLYGVTMLRGNTPRSEELFISGINRVLLLAALAAAAIALVLAFVLSRRILRPVEALTGAVSQMGQGDLSQRVRVSSRDEIGRLAQAFNTMADSLDRGERLRRDMVSDVAHELRTPLTNIRCQLESVQDGITQSTPAVINSIHEEAMLLHRLIDDLQDLSLAEAGKLSLKPERVSVRDAVAVAVSAISSSLGNGTPSIQVEVPDQCPDVLADSKRFGQVLRNLLNNAVAHTPQGGNITVRAQSIDAKVEVGIEDNGSGIAPEDLPYVFERFYRADASRDHTTGGAGLGLAIVNQLVAAQGGETRIESTLGKGTKVCFTLPVFHCSS
jgi:signal transduction histidine kinase